MEIFNNPWIVGIGGGILSGLVVTIISRFIFSRRDNREYLQKVATANREVIDAIRPGISEDVIPTVGVVDSMIASSARKYGVEIKDMLTPKQVAQDLVKEVMDSDFVSAKMKTTFCDELSQLTAISTPTASDATAMESSQITAPATLAEYRQRSVTLISTMMGLLVALMTFIVAFGDKGFNLAANEIFKILPPTVFALMAIAVVVSVAILDMFNRRLRNGIKTEDRAMQKPETTKEG